jgi:hypothetical protein
MPIDPPPPALLEFVIGDDGGLPVSGRVIRGSYMMPPEDFQLFAALKARAAATGAVPDNSELLRAGLHALMDAGRAELRRDLERLPPTPPRRRRGRPARLGSTRR